MFHSKKREIQRYWQSVPVEKQSPFDDLLKDYLSGFLKERLSDFGMKRISVYIDWKDDYRCINIDGRIDKEYADIQIEQDHFSLARAEDEPDEHVEYPLESPERFYDVVKRMLEE